MKRKIAILGATGSIGKSTLDLIERSPERFEIVAVTAATNIEALADIARRTGAKFGRDGRRKPRRRSAGAACGDANAAPRGHEALVEAAAGEAELVIAAIVGCAGLVPVMAAVEAGRTVALANKEALVTAGALMTDAAARHGATLLPIDSEHNAIFQCLAGNRRADVSRLILTASGGPFRTASADEMAHRHAGAGGRASQMVDGREDLGRFGDDDEQGPRADRGALPVRPAVGADRRPDPPAIGDPLAGRISSTARCLRSSAARTCASRSPMRWPGPSEWRRRPSGSTSRPLHGSTSKRLISNAFPRCGLRAKRSRRAGRHRSSSTPPTRSRWRHFWLARSGSVTSPRAWRKRSRRQISPRRARSPRCSRSTGSPGGALKL